MIHHLISLMILFPFLGALLQMIVPASKGADRGGADPSGWIALAASLAASICGIVAVASMQTEMPDLQLSEAFSWISSYAINYEMGLDGMNVLMVLGLSILFPVVIASEFSRTTGRRGMLALFLMLQASLVGAICSQDLFLQFLFWGFTALPLYFLVAIWGGDKREGAAFRFLMSAAVGNALMLAALFLIFYSADPHSFSLRELAGGKFSGKTFEFLGNECSVSSVALLLIALGMALRIAVWPLHGWFLEIASEAPPSAFVILVGSVLPVGIYILIRNAYTLFPETLPISAPFWVSIGALNILIGALCAVAQKRVRTLVAYTGISQLGLVLIGVGSMTSAGMVGTIYQVVVLGLALAGFGLFAGWVEVRTGSDEFGSAQPCISGAISRAPFLALIVAVILSSLLGLPGLGGFVGQALVVIGSYAIHPVVVLLAAISALLATYYLFSMFRKIFFGAPLPSQGNLPDLSLWERAYFFPLGLSLITLGLYPKPFLDLVRPTVLVLLSSLPK